LKIRVLKAQYGDSIILEWLDNLNIERTLIIDSGVPQTYSDCLKKTLESKELVDGFLLTHIDRDHIGGLYKYISSKFYDSKKISKFFINQPELIYFPVNSRKQSISDSINFYNLLGKKDSKEKLKALFIADDMPYEYSFNNLKLIILSPYKENIDNLNTKYFDFKITHSNQTKKTKDNYSKLEPLIDLYKEDDIIKSNIFNDSSIAFIAENKNKRILFLGDSNPNIVFKSLLKLGYNENNPIYFDCVKLSHHGSKFSITKDFISVIRSEKFIISTNGGYGRSYHPDRATIAKIVCSPYRSNNLITFYFNYKKNYIEQRTGNLWTEKEELDFNYNHKVTNCLEGIKL
jgi:metal-dependent hydrolase (beta-lactamase superfamily II)